MTETSSLAPMRECVENRKAAQFHPTAARAALKRAMLSAGQWSAGL
jgi:hypothetical protein